MTLQFNCKYQIVAMPMIGVSDYKLAIACANAGILPSLNSINYIHKNFDFFERLNYELSYCSNNGNILINFLAAQFLNNLKQNLDIILKYNIKYILIQYGDSKIDNSLLFKTFRALRNKGIMIFVSEHHNIENYATGIINEVDGVFVKGPDVGGICRDYDKNLVDAIKKFKNKHDVSIIAVGGIGDKKDIEESLLAGASAVGIGTLLAMSEESSLSIETKMKMVKATSKDLTFIDVYRPDNPNYKGKQRALFFSDYDDKSDDIRNRKGLLLGVQNKGGHVYAGNGISKLNELLPVKTIIERLISI